MGAPRKPDSERRTVPIGFRVTRADASALRDLAVQMGCSRSSLLTRLIKYGPGDMPRPVPPVNAAAWSRLSATTANLNQISAHLNELALAGEPLSSALFALPHSVEALQREVAALRAELIGDQVEAPP